MISDEPWGQFSDSDYDTAQEFCDASLINLNDGPRDKWTKSACKLRYKEPDGNINRNGVHAAAAALAGARGGVDAPPAAKRKAARKLVGLYRQMNEQPPESLTRLAS